MARSVQGLLHLLHVRHRRTRNRKRRVRGKKRRRRGTRRGKGQKETIQEVKRSKKSKKHRRRSSSGSSESSSSLSSHSSVFRVTSASGGASSQLRLIEWAKRRPGKLAQKGLQTTQDRIGSESEEPMHSWSAAPPVAKLCHLRSLEPQNASAGLQNWREMQTLCHILDHFAMGRVAQASDLVFQRLKSIEKSVHESNWEKAKFLELILGEKVSPLLLFACSPFPTCICLNRQHGGSGSGSVVRRPFQQMVWLKASLTSKDEDYLANKALEFERKLAGNSKPYGGGWKPYGGKPQPRQWNKYTPYNQQPDDKGNGKGKNHGLVKEVDPAVDFERRGRRFTDDGSAWAIVCKDGGWELGRRTLHKSNGSWRCWLPAETAEWAGSSANLQDLSTAPFRALCLTLAINSYLFRQQLQVEHFRPGPCIICLNVVIASWRVVSGSSSHSTTSRVQDSVQSPLMQGSVQHFLKLRSNPASTSSETFAICTMSRQPRLSCEARFGCCDRETRHMQATLFGSGVTWWPTLWSQRGQSKGRQEFATLLSSWPSASKMTSKTPSVVFCPRTFGQLKRQRARSTRPVQSGTSSAGWLSVSAYLHQSRRKRFFGTSTVIW